MPLFPVQSQSLRAREIPRGGEGEGSSKTRQFPRVWGWLFEVFFRRLFVRLVSYRFPLITCILFKIFLQFSLPPNTIQSWNSAKILDTRVQHRFWGEGRGWTCVNWKTPLKRESVPRLLSMIEGSEFKTYCRRCYKFLGKPWPAMKEYHFLKPIFHHFHAMKR